MTGLDVPAGEESLEGRARIQKLRPLLERLHVRSEAGFIRHLPEEQRLIIPVSTPRSEAAVDLHLRGNWVWTRVWGVFADATVYQQAGIRGEVEWLTQTQAPGHPGFRVTRLGYTYEVDLDQSRGIASVHRTAVNAWGILSALHHFNGVHAGDPRNTRDWFLTTAWTFCMDALAAGLIFTALSGVYIRHRSGHKRFTGLVALFSGTLASCVVLFGRG